MKGFAMCVRPYPDVAVGMARRHAMTTMEPRAGSASAARPCAATVPAPTVPPSAPGRQLARRTPPPPPPLTRGLQLFPIQLNLSSAVHRISRLSS